MRNALWLFCHALINMKYLLLLSAFLLTACAATPAQVVYPTRTPDPIQPYMDASASKGTAIAAVATAEYFSMQLTGTVETRNQITTQQEFSLQATQQAANILATEQAWNATSTADSIQSTSAASGTASAAVSNAIFPVSFGSPLVYVPRADGLYAYTRPRSSNFFGSKMVIFVRPIFKIPSPSRAFRVRLSTSRTVPRRIAISSSVVQC